MRPSLTPSDLSSAREVSAFLKRVGLTALQKSFEAQWNEIWQIQQEKLDEASTSAAPGSAAVDAAANKRGPYLSVAAPPPLAAEAAPPTWHTEGVAAGRDNCNSGGAAHISLPTVRTYPAHPSDDGGVPVAPMAGESVAVRPKQNGTGATSGGAERKQRSVSYDGGDARSAAVEAGGLLPILATRRGVVTTVGIREDLWEPAPAGEPLVSPVFARGAGLTRQAYLSALHEVVEWVPVYPYQKTSGEVSTEIRQLKLPVMFYSGCTGFEEEPEFPVTPGTLIAGCYEIREYLNSAAFSRAVRCRDLRRGGDVCVKIIRNSKDFFDQSLDEIKLLTLINSCGCSEKYHVVQLFEYFYYKEHMFLVCELLGDNLYDFARCNRESPVSEFYFTLARLQSITRQVLIALQYIHSLGLIHCDLKPENIVFRSVRRCEVRLIDFGSSCYLADKLSSYVQSRSYRAPEVILGCRYDGRVDIWSLGAILPELATGHVLFDSRTVASMLATMSALCGPFPAEVLHEGRHSHHFVTQHGAFYEWAEDGNELRFLHPEEHQAHPQFAGYEDAEFVDFVRSCLTIDFRKRPTATELLQHAFLQKDYGETRYHVEGHSVNSALSFPPDGVAGETAHPVAFTRND